MSPLDILGERPGPRGTAPDDVPPSGLPPLVLPIHDCVPGRVRWHVPGLRGAPALKAVLETRLRDMPGLHAAHASTETGNLLTNFDPAISTVRVRERVTAILRGDVTSPGDDAGAAPAWFACPVDDVGAALRTSVTRGLDTVEAGERLAEHGANTLPVPPARSGLSILMGQLNTLPVGLLVVAAGFSLLTGAAIEAAAIAVVVAVNGVLGTVVETRSERIIRSLGANAGHEPAHVVRNGAEQTVPPETVVPGDLLVLRPGTVVPADARVVSASDLRVAEAMLTGESLPVAKQGVPVGRAAALADRTSMVFRGTAVTGGSGTAIVVATGIATEMGRIQQLVGTESTPQTPMQRQLDTLGRQLVWASLAACATVMGLGALRNIALMQILRSGVSLAVAAVPEGLPTVATTTLALGIEDMRKRGVLVRRLDAVESLASVTVACFDKTGTLTLNRMRVVEVVAGGQRYRTGPDGVLLDAGGDRRAVDMAGAGPGPADPLGWLLRVAVLCSDADLVEQEDGGVEPAGTATETALVRLALDAGLDAARLREAHPLLSVRRRSEGYRYMATAHRDGHPPSWPGGGPILVAVKGSPAEVLDLCAFELRDGRRQALTAERRTAVGRANDAMAADALRVLGCAVGSGPEDDADSVPTAELTWVGLAGLADPLRPGMEALMRALHGAGLRTVMMTGDQVSTALAVARQLGLAGDAPVEVFDAARLGDTAPDELAAAARRAHVFARVSPAEKLQIVRAMQAAGERVAMTGDGINDSPALKAADVGIAMGGEASSEAAREVADVVLQTDDLAALATAVERGRATFVNVRKSVRYLLATNFSEILVVLGATATGMGEPLTAMQLLWINLVSDVLPGLGLACEPPEPGLMQRPPFPAAGNMVERAEVGRLAAQGGLIAIGSLAALGWGVLRHGASSPQARTMGFASLVSAQLLHALTARSDRHGPFTGGDALPPNRPLRRLLLASAGVQAVGLLVPGIRGTLGVVALGPADLLVTAAAGVLPFVATEALKAARPRLADAAPPLLALPAPA